MPVTASPPELKTWLSLFDLLENKVVTSDQADELEAQFSAMCVQQGLTPTPAQVKATVEHYLAQQATLTSTVAQPSPGASFRLWKRPTVTERAHACQRLDEEQTAAEETRREGNNPWFLRYFLVGAGLTGWLTGYLVTRPTTPAEHVAYTWVSTFCGTFFLGTVIGVVYLLLLTLPTCWWYERFLKRKHARRYADVFTLQKTWSIRGAAREALSPKKPSVQDMQVWMSCPATLTALRLLNQEPVSLLGLDADHLNQLAYQWEQQQKDQANETTRLALESAWRELVGTRLLDLPTPQR